MGAVMWFEISALTLLALNLLALVSVSSHLSDVNQRLNLATQLLDRIAGLMEWSK
jgi:hypothetical protein